MQTTFTVLQTRGHRIAHNHLPSVTPIGTNVIAEGGRP